jgi:hypothetical protein
MAPAAPFSTSSGTIRGLTIARVSEKRIVFDEDRISTRRNNCGECAIKVFRRSRIDPMEGDSQPSRQGHQIPWTALPCRVAWIDENRDVLDCWQDFF